MSRSWSPNVVVCGALAELRLFAVTEEPGDEPTYYAAPTVEVLMQTRRHARNRGPGDPDSVPYVIRHYREPVLLCGGLPRGSA